MMSSKNLARKHSEWSKERSSINVGKHLDEAQKEG